MERNSNQPTEADTVFSVAGRRVAITGGTAGIGLAVAEHLSAAGARVVVTGRRSSGPRRATEAGAGFVPMDVADEASVAAGFEAVATRLGHLDALILNAGIDAGHGEVGELDLAVFTRIMDVNTMGVVRALNCGVGLVRDGGSVVVTSSPAGSVAVPGMAAYAASKAALDHLVRVWALELGDRRIRVNAVLPGIIESELGTDSQSTGGNAGDESSRPDIEMIRRLTASGIYRQAAEMGPVFHFLVSDASESLTGSLVGCHDGISVGYNREILAGLAMTTGDVVPG